ncbi:uncharacterized protein [Macrobrachium rosenbergii]|uniref:uncharacterized protein n=1 Tax=Macrobrachium rosenbergii TaxID=79674 RepID=UPI0034D7B96D
MNIPVNSLQDLLSHGKIPWLIELGSHIHHTFMKAESGLYKKILKDAVIIKAFGAEREWARKQRLAAIIPITSMKKALSDDYSKTSSCFYYIAREPVVAVPFALAFPKGSDLVQHFNKWLDAQKESGIIDHSIIRETANATACLVSPGKEGSKGYLPFSVLDLSGIFLIFVVGTGISLVTFGIELLVKRTNG